LNLWLDFHNVFCGIRIWFWGFVNWVMMLVYVSLLEWVLVDWVVSIGRIHRLDSLLLEIVIAKSEWWLIIGFLVMFAWICWFWIGVGLRCLIRRKWDEVLGVHLVKYGPIWMGVFGGTQIWFLVSNLMMWLFNMWRFWKEMYHCHLCNELSSMVYEIVF
jgi:hypothetical protein